MKPLVVIVTTLIVLLPCTSPWAQAYYERHTAIGLKGGLGMAGLYGRGVDELAGPVGPRLSYMAGFFINVPAKRIFSLQPELYYSVKGARRTGELVDSANNIQETGTITTRLAYLEIPILLKATLRPEARVSPTFFAGPAFMILQSAKIEFRDGRSLTYEIDESVRDIDFGLVVGGGADFVFGTGHLTTEARFTLGLRSIDASSRDLAARNYDFTVLLGFAFPLIRSF